MIPTCNLGFIGPNRNRTEQPALATSPNALVLEVVTRGMPEEDPSIRRLGYWHCRTTRGLHQECSPFGHPRMQQGQLLCMMQVLHKLISQALEAMAMMQSSAISSQITAATAINLSGATD